MTERRWTVSVGDAGLRLDVALARWADLSRRQARRCLQRGWVVVGGRKVDEAEKGRRLASGDVIQLLESPDLLEKPMIDSELELSVIDGSEDWIAIDKPAGIGVHPLDAEQSGTVLNALLRLHPQVMGVGEGGLRSGVVHRLDVDTTGVLVMALTPAGFDRWRAAFREHRVRKTYWALVEGQLADRGDVQLALRMRRHRPARVEVAPSDSSSSSSARVCRTSWSVLARSAHHSLVEVRPTTGHLHQIRVTLAHLGAPILGDAVYGRALDGVRHLLHARAIEFEGITLLAPPPPDFSKWRQRLGFG